MLLEYPLLRYWCGMADYPSMPFMSSELERDELSPSLYENADFSRNTVEDSIKNGELKTNEILPLIGWEKCDLARLSQPPRSPMDLLVDTVGHNGTAGE